MNYRQQLELVQKSEDFQAEQAMKITLASDVVLIQAVDPKPYGYSTIFDSQVGKVLKIGGNVAVSLFGVGKIVLFHDSKSFDLLIGDPFDEWRQQNKSSFGRISFALIKADEILGILPSPEE